MTRLLIAAATLAAASSVASAQAPQATQPRQAVAVTLSEWKVELPRDTVKAGAVILRVNNTGSMSHALYVRGEGVDQGTREISARQSASLAVTLWPGTYEVFCPLSDMSHKQAGMSRQLVVTASDAPPAPKKPGS